MNLIIIESISISIYNIHISHTILIIIIFRPVESSIIHIIPKVTFTFIKGIEHSSIPIPIPIHSSP